MRSPKHSEVDGHQIRIRTLESELLYLQDRTRAAVEQLQAHQAKLAEIQGVIAFPQVPALDSL
jgi:hypothetical protein